MSYSNYDEARRRFIDIIPEVYSSPEVRDRIEQHLEQAFDMLEEAGRDIEEEKKPKQRVAKMNAPLRIRIPQKGSREQEAYQRGLKDGTEAAAILPPELRVPRYNTGVTCVCTYHYDSEIERDFSDRYIHINVTSRRDVGRESEEYHVRRTVSIMTLALDTGRVLDESADMVVDIVLSIPCDQISLVRYLVPELVSEFYPPTDSERREDLIDTIQRVAFRRLFGENITQNIMRGN